MAAPTTIPWLVLGLIPLLLLAGVVVVCILVIARGVWVPRRIPRRAACGNCAYETAFNSPTCSECGSDLRSFGTLTAHTAVRLRSNPVSMIVAWTILIGMVCAGAVGLYMSSPAMAATAVTSGSFHTQFTPVRSLMVRPSGGIAESQQRYDMSLTAAYSGSDWTTFSLNIVPDDGPRALVTMNIAERSWVLEGVGDPVQGSGLDIAAVRQFYEAAQLDTDDEVIQLEMNQFASILDQAATGDPSVLQNGGWQIDDPRLEKIDRTVPEPRPAFKLLRAGGHTTGHGDDITSESREFYRGQYGSGMVEVEIEYETGDGRRPTSLRSLSVSVVSDVGWPIEIQCDLDADTWQAIRGDETIMTGDRPATVQDCERVILTLGPGFENPQPAWLAADVAALINLTDDDLIGFTGWTPPRPRNIPTETTGGLARYGGGGGSTTMMERPPYGVLFYILAGGFILAWLAGGWCILARRRRLITPPKVTS